MEAGSASAEHGSPAKTDRIFRASLPVKSPARNRRHNGYEAAVAAILEGFEDRRLSGSGRPVQARTVFDILVRDCGYGGSYQAVVRYLRRRYGVPPVRAFRRE